ncbi:DUF6544 family protein [Hymenobacter seoulensis]
MLKKTTIGLLATIAFAGPLVGLFLARRAGAWRRRADVQRLFALLPEGAGTVYHEAALDGLPAPVQRYFRRVLRDGQPYLRSLRLRHTGQFKTDLQKSWVAITGEQYITADPPGFIWEGTTRQFVARDELIAGRGRLAVRLLGALPIAGGTGPAYDQGELLRWLLECTWLPTALLPSNSITWTAIDKNQPGLRLPTGASPFPALPALMSGMSSRNAKPCVSWTLPRNGPGLAASNTIRSGTACSSPQSGKLAGWWTAGRCPTPAFSCGRWSTTRPGRTDSPLGRAGKGLGSPLPAPWLARRGRAH